MNTRLKKLLKYPLKMAIQNRVEELSLPHILPHKAVNTAKKIVHFTAFTYGNAGDAILPTNVKDSVEFGLPYEYEWKAIHAHKFVDEKIVKLCNNSNGIIIGGGGLFLKDTNPNNNSGWQWNCSVDQLKKITVPITLFSVGYNRFRDQADFEPIFKQHLNLLAEKSLFLGLRNTGSINKVTEYLIPSNRNKLRYQPCPTTIISQLYPGLIETFPKEEDKFVALNCAFDRSRLRYGEHIGDKLTSIARVIKKLSLEYKIKYYEHVGTDNYFIPFLDSFGIKYDLIKIESPLNIIQEYSKPSLVIGMRGHSQMIPFGCKTPILSVISHEKMKWFLEDINHPEWGCEITNPHFESDLYEKSIYMLNNRNSVIEDIKSIQKDLFNITINNVLEIRKNYNL
ncbi:polysaccharide pyruvyl transferase family protein [Prevotella sp. 10(H)]|uniref:polysaccharide pyruvyl transferase family protein n=1 Tax=Prevotella sp. 10(H) TaxID=1158294 RepID=UPI00068CFEDB|nr:polysaccharide pyruvyl transferase family protein [Prevotella sp. 10(H)]